jgi:hypothetical protein
LPFDVGLTLQPAELSLQKSRAQAQALPWIHESTRADHLAAELWFDVSHGHAGLGIDLYHPSNELTQSEVISLRECLFQVLDETLSAPGVPLATLFPSVSHPSEFEIDLDLSA